MSASIEAPSGEIYAQIPLPQIQEAPSPAEARAAACFERQFSDEAAGSSPSLEDLSVEQLFQRVDECELDFSAVAEADRAFGELSRRPVSLEMIQRVVARKGKPIRLAERKLMTRIMRELPDLNRVLVSYELLKRETERMDLNRFRPRMIRAEGGEFQAHETGGAEFRFLVHAAGLDEGTIEEIRQKRIRSGFLCTSLICDSFPYFYEARSNFAMVLAADPRTIAATTREDAFTPYASRSPGTMQFYRFYQRLQLLTSYVDKIYRELGIGDHPASDSISRLNRLKSQEAEGISSPEMQAEAGALQQAILGREDTYQRVQDHYKTFGLARQKMKEIAKRLEDEPAIASEKAREELRLAKELLEEIDKDLSIFNTHVHPIQGVGDLIGQTQSQPINNFNYDGSKPYNEVNLDLSTRFEEGFDPIAVKAILIDQFAFERNPGNFTKILVDAKAHGIPILITQDPLLSQEEIRRRLLIDVEKGIESNVRKWIESGQIDGETAGKALVLAVRAKAYYSCCSTILTVQEIPERYLKEAFLLAVERKDDLTISSLRNAPEEACKKIVAEFVSGDPEWIPPSIVQFLLDRGFNVSPMVASRILRQLMKEYRPDSVGILYSRFKDRIPREELDEIFSGPQSDHFDFSLSNLPIDEIERCLLKAIERKNLSKIEKFFQIARFIPFISPLLAAAALEAAKKEGDQETTLTILSVYPEFEDRWRGYFVEAVQNGDGAWAYRLFSRSHGSLNQAAIELIPRMEKSSSFNQILNELFVYVDAIPPAHAGRFLIAALEEKLANRAIEIYKFFKGKIPERELTETYPAIARSGSVEMICEVLPRDQLRSCFLEAVRQGQWIRMLYLAQDEVIKKELLPEDLEWAVSSAVNGNMWSHDLAEFINSMPTLRDHLKSLALKLAGQHQTDFYLNQLTEALSDRSEEWDLLPQERAAFQKAAIASDDEDFHQFSEDDFADIPALPPEEDISQKAALIASPSISVQKAALAIPKIAPFLTEPEALNIAQFAYAGMQSEEFHEPLAQRLARIPEPQFSKAQAYLIKYVQMPGNREKFGRFGQLDALETALKSTTSAVPPLPVKKGALKKRKVAAQHGFSLLSLALSAIKAPFHLAGWAAAGALKACRRRLQTAR